MAILLDGQDGSTWETKKEKQGRKTIQGGKEQIEKGGPKVGRKNCRAIRSESDKFQGGAGREKRFWKGDDREESLWEDRTKKNRQKNLPGRSVGKKKKKD